MTFAARIAIPLVAGVLAAVHAPAVHCRPAPRGQAETVVPLRPLIDMPEGIAIDHRGNIYVSNRRLENDSRVCEILRIASDGVRLPSRCASIAKSIIMIAFFSTMPISMMMPT